MVRDDLVADLGDRATGLKVQLPAVFRWTGGLRSAGSPFFELLPEVNVTCESRRGVPGTDLSTASLVCFKSPLGPGAGSSGGSATTEPARAGSVRAAESSLLLGCVQRLERRRAGSRRRRRLELERNYSPGSGSCSGTRRWSGAGVDSSGRSGM